jgi:hypothetical protein
MMGDALGRVLSALRLALALAGCAAAIARNPVPVSLEGNVEVVGMGPAQVRFWGDQLPPNAEALVKEKWAQVRANRPEFLANGRRPVVNFLALSGGAPTAPLGQGYSAGGPHRGNAQNSIWSPAFRRAR